MLSTLVLVVLGLRILIYHVDAKRYVDIGAAVGQLVMDRNETDDDVLQPGLNGLDEPIELAHIPGSDTIDDTLDHVPMIVTPQRQQDTEIRKKNDASLEPFEIRDSSPKDERPYGFQIGNSSGHWASFLTSGWATLMEPNFAVEARGMNHSQWTEVTSASPHYMRGIRAHFAIAENKDVLSDSPDHEKHLKRMWLVLQDDWTGKIRSTIWRHRIVRIRATPEFGLIVRFSGGSEFFEPHLSGGNFKYHLWDRWQPPEKGTYPWTEFKAKLHTLASVAENRIWTDITLGV